MKKDKPKKSEDNSEIKLRTYLSYNHLRSAIFFANKLSEVEQAYLKKKNAELAELHSTYASSIIIRSVAFLEATINEFFSDVSDNFFDPKLVDENVHSLVKRLWELGIPRSAAYSILDKYQIGLALFQKEAFEKGGRPYQDIDVLIGFRNYLIHYEPEWQIMPDSGNRLDHLTRLEKRLNHKFDLNPLYPKNSVPFPLSHYSHSAAKWSLLNSIHFVDNFFSRLGTVSKLEWMRAELVF